MGALRHAPMTFEHDGRHMTLMYVHDAVGVWAVYEGMAYLGVIVETLVLTRSQET
jgi:hypothetical protein